MIFQNRDTLTLESYSEVIKNETSDLLVNMLKVLRDCFPCTQTFWENMHAFYKDFTLASPSIDVPLPAFETDMTNESGSPRNQFSAAGGGSAGSAMLKNYQKPSAAPTPAAKARDEPEEFDELAFEDNIKFVAEGF